MVAIHGPWAEYAREQHAARKRELNELADVSGCDALDFILDAIGLGRPFTREDARRRRLSSARRERAQFSLRERHAAAYESDLQFRERPSPELATLLASEVALLPDHMARVMLLDARGHTDREIGAAVGIKADAVRQRLSRAGRRLAA